MRIIMTLVTLASLAAAAVTAQATEVKRTIKLHQDKPALSHLDLGAGGSSHGDMLAFEAPLSGENGLKGRMLGLLITVDIADGDDTFEDRSGQIYLDLGGGNSLVVAGRSVYKGDSQEMEAGSPQLRAVIGGTGDFMGAMGQMTTTRDADGSYHHVVELVN